MTARRARYGRAALSSRTRAVLAILRIYVLIAVPLVVYAFIAALHT